MCTLPSLRPRCRAHADQGAAHRRPAIRRAIDALMRHGRSAQAQRSGLPDFGQATLPHRTPPASWMRPMPSRAWRWRTMTRDGSSLARIGGCKRDRDHHTTVIHTGRPDHHRRPDNLRGLPAPWLSPSKSTTGRHRAPAHPDHRCREPRRDSRHHAKQPCGGAGYPLHH
jgi:hypothetical protein